MLTDSKTTTENLAEKAGNFENQLFKAADKLRNNIDAAEYKHVVLGLVFLKYISDSFETLHARLTAGEGEYQHADAEDPDEYRAENVFWVPPNARWSHIKAQAKTGNHRQDFRRIHGGHRKRKQHPERHSAESILQAKRRIRNTWRVDRPCRQHRPRR